MPFKVPCACGKTLLLKDEWAGRKVRCSGCNQILLAAQPSAPKNVASAGFTSRKPKRTMRIETSTATIENTARLRAHDARLDTGSD